jgi:hypothetical protein
MHAKMNLLRTSLALAALLGTAAVQAAPGGCEQVVAAGQTFFNGAGFDGDAYSSIGDLAVSVAVLEQAETGSGLRAATAHTFTALDGSLVFGTRDNAMLKPVNAAGLFELNTQALIIEGGHGQLSIDGLVDFARGWARWTAKGTFCSG